MKMRVVLGGAWARAEPMGKSIGRGMEDGSEGVGMLAFELLGWYAHMSATFCMW